MDYTDILNSINSKLATIIEWLSDYESPNGVLSLIMAILCVFLVLYAIKGE